MADNLAENNFLTNIAATKANKDLGNKLTRSKKHLLSGSNRTESLGTIILDKYLESEINRDNSYRDPMTNLLNRRGLVEEYKLEQSTSNRLGGYKTNALIALDLIGLKKLNNKLKSEGADEVLKNAALSLNNSKRKTDLACRWGGDEFLLALFGADKEAAEKMIEKILNNLPTHVNYNIGYKIVESAGDGQALINEVVNKMDDIKKMGGVDMDGRATGTGVVVNIDNLKNNV